ncbi:MAG: polysaccharide deacetylase family protein [Candidatus Competibacter sp.]|nr:polysaccharide deacetylase family protein [Candidatus Competibacter sp.]
MPVILSVDVEDWAQSTLDTSLPIYPRAQRNTEHLLDVVAEQGHKLTCFVLGLFAKEFPETVRRMAREGHEVASHGYGHVNIYEQTQDAFREDVRRSKAQLEDLIGESVVGYRGPNFSLGKAGDWPLEILAEEGFRYDSSIFPSPTYRHGRADWPAHPVRVELPSGRNLVEFPAATLRLFGRVLPVAGGGYHRLLPWPMIRWAVSRSMAANDAFTLYCHPYEFDPDEFAHLPFEIPLKVRLHQGLGRRGFEGKFRKLLTTFETATARQIVDQTDWPVYRLKT